MTQNDIWQIARRQSAIDLGCRAEDFTRTENVIVLSKRDPRARKYLELPFSCQLVSYGANIVASVSEPLRPAVEAYLAAVPTVHYAFETPQIQRLNALLRPFGERICFMAEYFLPELDILAAPECAYELRLMGPADFAALYRPEWSNALCEKRAELDVLGVGAFDGGELIGLAACSADGDEMWQIGVDVLPSHRRQGVAPALTGRLAQEILARDKVPFYCAAWSNIPSVRNAIRCGFRPAWVELTARSDTFTESVLRGD